MTTTIPASGTGGDSAGAPAGADLVPAVRRRLPMLAALPVAAIAGLVLDAAFPDIGFWPAALVAPGVLLLLVRGRGPAAGFALATLFGLGFWVAHVRWTGIYVGALPWLALSTLLALFLGAVGALWTSCWRLADRVGRWSLLLTAPAVWIAVEALRSRWPFTGFPWGRIGFSQADSPLAWLVAIGGVPFLGFTVVALSCGLALVAVAALDGDLRRPRRMRSWGRVTAPLAIALVLASALAGAARVANALDEPTDEVRIAAVQGNVPEPGLDFNAERRAVTDNHVRATLALADAIEAGDEAPVAAVFWPENASDIDPLRNPDAADVISGATDAVGVPVFVGAVLREPAENLTNAYLVWEPGTGYRGDLTGRYAKQRPAPFGEFIPYRAFFRSITKVVDEAPRDFVAGPGPGVLAAGDGIVVGPGICFEVADDGVMGNQVRAGANLLVIPTNNATFGFTDESEQQIVMSKLRAIEFDRSVVHISTVGVSAVFAPDGSSTPRTDLFTQDVITAPVSLHDGTTLSEVVGQWPEKVVALAVAAWTLWLVTDALARVLVRRRAATTGPGAGA